MQFKYQVNGWECGTRSIQNALFVLGEESDKNKIRLFAGTDKSGTSKRGIARAIRSLGFRATIYQTRDSDNAWRWLRRNSALYPCIALVDEGYHWSTFTGIVADKVILIDPSQYQTKSTPDNTGTFCYSKREALSRWNNGGIYYAIRVSRM